MNLYGLQKVTLLDFPGHVACTVFTGGCDFRCPYCHNFQLASAPGPAQISEEQFFSFLKSRLGRLDGVAVTGGEPCLHPGLPDFLKKIKALGFQTKLDTNGFHPEMLRSVLKAGLADYVAMDIKAAPWNYARAVGLPSVDLAPIHESVSMLLSGGTDYEFRTTVVKEIHSTEDFYSIGPWIQGATRYFLQPFVSRSSVPCLGLHAPERETLEAFLLSAQLFVPSAALRGVEYHPSV